MSETKESTNWRVYHQSYSDRYESQQAALVAIESILSEYENDVYNERFPFIHLSCEQGETIDSDRTDRYHYVNSLNSRSGNTFTIDVFIKNKEDWIFSYGSDLLQQSILVGYECNDGYLQPKTTILLDNGYHPDKLTQALEAIYPEIMTKIQFELSAKPSKAEKAAKGQSGFVPVAARWVIERSNAWVERCKSLVKNFDRTLARSNAKLKLCFIRLMLKRLAAT